MTDSKKVTAAAIAANTTAWSSLVGVLAAQGVLDLDVLDFDLRQMQQKLREAKKADIAEALDWHLGLIESWKKEDDLT
ncbi:hypothetical protein EXW94_24020 [Enterobacter sp. JMULE2]|uniref:hypothetical protein n=1 Tax=Enterobacter sp. JMULE2 TaxID=2518340 RepID=UPI0015771CF6|nr:hypothetical protein [Enterobacter sp. JMULE2]NTZ40685.1 hypothetical protein [Enterobacter sp. JMULE2]